MTDRLDSAGGHDRRTWAALTFVVFALAWFVLETGHPPAPLHGDTTEDLLLARACIENGICETSGASTTVSGVEQGALWLSLLAALRGAGASAQTILSGTFALAAASVALLFAFVWRRRPVVASVAATALLWMTLSGRALHVLWNPSLTPLPAALLLVVALDQLERRGRFGWLPLGCALGLTLETHPVAALVVPGALVLAGWATRPRWFAAASPLLAGAVALGLYVVVSPGAALGNVAVAAQRAGGWLLAGALCLPVVVLALHSRLVSSTPRTRSVVTAVALGLPALMVVFVGALLDPDGPTGPRYAAPAFPALALLIGEASAPWLQKRLPQALAVAVAGFLFFRPFTEPHAVQLRQPGLEALADSLRHEGRTLDDTLLQLSGPRCVGVLGELAALGMPIEGPVTSASEDSLIVVPAPSPEVDVELFGRGRWRQVPTPPGSELLVGEMETWVDRRRFSACAEPLGDGLDDGRPDEPICVERDLAEGARALFAPNGAELEMTTLRIPSIHLREGTRPLRVGRVTYRLPVRVPPNAGTREVRLAYGRRYACRSFAFESVEGLRVEGPLPARTVRLQASDTWQEGHVVITMEIGECDENSVEVLPPCLVELDDRDPEALRALLLGDESTLE